MNDTSTIPTRTPRTFLATSDKEKVIVRFVPRKEDNLPLYEPKTNTTDIYD